MYSFHIILVSYITEVGDHFSKVAIVTVIAVLPRYTAIDSYIGGTIYRSSFILLIIIIPACTYILYIIRASHWQQGLSCKCKLVDEYDTSIV
jgi:multisubunit Na+/H+ antiporter MnhG subunit